MLGVPRDFDHDEKNQKSEFLGILVMMLKKLGIPNISNIKPAMFLNNYVFLILGTRGAAAPMTPAVVQRKIVENHYFSLRKHGQLWFPIEQIMKNQDVSMKNPEKS